MQNVLFPKWVLYYGGFITLMPMALAVAGFLYPAAFFPMLEGWSFEHTIGGVIGPYLVRNFCTGLITGFALFVKKSPEMFSGMLALRLMTDICDFLIVVISGTVVGLMYLPIIVAFAAFLWLPTFYSYKALQGR